MSSISVATIVANAVRLRYPLEAVLSSVAPIASEVVVNVDNSRLVVGGEDDGTFDLVDDILDRLEAAYPQVRCRVLPETWNWENRIGGTEIAIQSNKAVDACTGTHILHLQADEMIHSDDHDYLKWLADTLDDSWAGVEFVRLYFWRDLHTLRTDWTQPLVRMFRKGRGRVAGDGMNCEVDGKVWPVVRDGAVPTPSLWHYSRIGKAAAIAKRIQTLDSLFHDPETIDRRPDYSFPLQTFDSYAAGTVSESVSPDVLVPFEGSHPEPARKLYG